MQYGDIIFDYGVGDLNSNLDEINHFSEDHTPNELRVHQVRINMVTRKYFVYYANLGLLRAHPVKFIIALSFISAIYYICTKHFTPWTNSDDPFWVISNKTLLNVANDLADDLKADSSFIFFDLHRLAYRTPTLDLP